MPSKKGLAKASPKKTLDHYIKARNGKKRDYIFDFKKAKTCSHPNLVEMAIGGSFYRCTQCNYAMAIVTGYMQPIHQLVKQSILNLFHFGKEFGGASLQEVLRTPSGQTDGTAHKPALPEGLDFAEALALLEGVDVNTEDMGRAQMAALVDENWVRPKERALRNRELKKLAPPPQGDSDDDQGKRESRLPEGKRTSSRRKA
jgi:hypothetical protein